MPLGPSCPLQTIPVSDLVGCGSPLQIVMAVWRASVKIGSPQEITMKRKRNRYSLSRQLFNYFCAVFMSNILLVPEINTKVLRTGFDTQCAMAHCAGCTVHTSEGGFFT